MEVNAAIYGRGGDKFTTGAPIYSDITCIQEIKLPDYYDVKPTVAELAEAGEINVRVKWIKDNIVKAIKEYEASFTVKAKKQKEQAQKGKVPQVIFEALLVITEDWKNIIYAKNLESLKMLRERALATVAKYRGQLLSEYAKNDKSFLKYCCVVRVIQDNTSRDARMQDDYMPIYSAELDSQLEYAAMESAKERSQSFLFKMCDKIGGMKQITDDVKVEKIMGRSNPFESAILVEAKDKFRFVMLNTIVHNRSVRGTPYYQFPCVFENVTIQAAGGEKKFTRLSETEIKKEINDLKA